MTFPLPVAMVTDSHRLADSVRTMTGIKAIGLDTESNSRHHYPEQLCLIQIATGHNVYIIDTITLENIEPLRKVLADKATMKVIHGADYDIRSLDRHCGFRVHNLYDTYVAARFAGLTEVGLAALLRDLLGVNIIKSKRLQTADWGRRPLSDEAIDYAAGDVHHLLALQQILDKRLKTLGRTEWVAEEFTRLEETRFNPPDMENSFRNVKGAEHLDARSLAVLRSIFLFREEESLRRHQPPFFVMPDEAMIRVAATPAINLAEVYGISQLPRFRAGLQQAVRDGLSATPVKPLPRVRFEPMTAEQLRRFAGLKAWRAEIAAKLALDPALLWPTPSLQQLAKEPEIINRENINSNVRQWQYVEFASSLRAYLKTNG
jgi:ribonuclease D